MTTRVFISYSHKDESHRVELDKHLSLMRRQGLVDVWSDHCIRPGEEFDPSINAALEAADLILLLISVDFTHSDYCFGIELRRAMERHAQGTAMVVPILLRPCDWHSAPFGKLKSLPTDGKPVTKWPTLDEAFLDIVQQLRSLLTKRRASSPPPPVTTPAATLGTSAPAFGAPAQTAGPARMARSSNLALPKKFTDEARHDFLIEAFNFIQIYFERSLRELQARNPGFSARLMPVTAQAFKAVIFENGERRAGCQIRIGAMFRTEEIAYSENENSAGNTANEMLSVEDDKQSLYLRAQMAMVTHSTTGTRLTEEGAAEHLWSMFISPLQR